MGTDTWRKVNAAVSDDVKQGKEKVNGNGNGKSFRTNYAGLLLGVQKIQ